MPNVPHERRGHSRIPVRHLQVGYRPGGWLKALVSPRFPGKAIAMDVSGSGMRLLVGHLQRVADTLAFQIHGARMNEHIRIAGRVTRCLKVRDQVPGKVGHLYELGIRLTRAGEDYRGLIGRFRQDPLLSQGF
jgi:hypothetical protein